MRSDHTQTLKLIILSACLLALTAAAIACKSSQRSAAPTAPAVASDAQPKATPNPDEAEVVTDKRKGYFDHSRKEHRVKPDGPVESCAVCHRRDPAKPIDVKLGQPERRTPTWLPFHEACTQCHGAEAFQQTGTDVLDKSPLCAACHRNGITKENVAQLFAYPARNNEFGLAGIAGEMHGFSHRTHTDSARMGDDSRLADCKTCHQFDGRGVKASFPRHQECFSCHVHQAEQKFGGCNTCHITSAQAVAFARGPEQAYKAFSFRHSPAHLKAANCSKCHQTVEPTVAKAVDILQIKTGQGQRHTSACWTCHKQSQEPVCTKCHTSPPATFRAGLGFFNPHEQASPHWLAFSYSAFQSLIATNERVN